MIYLGLYGISSDFKTIEDKRPETESANTIYRSIRKSLLLILFLVLRTVV